MKTAVLVGPEKIEVQEVETPKPKPTEVLVKLKNCGICTLEQRLFSGEMKIYFPIVPGHEVSGEVVEVGAGVISGLKKGMPVAVDLVMRCGECYFCRTGQSNMCENRFNEGLRVLGGFSEYIAVRPSQVYPFSNELSFREASFTEPVACCIRSLKRIGVSLADDVLIIGAGAMGQMHLQVARAMGARVIISDPDSKRLEKASELGAAVIVDPDNGNLKDEVAKLTGGRGADAVVVTSSTHAALNSAFESLSKTGRVSMTFYGLGFHEYRERWFTDEWYWYQSNFQPNLLQERMSKEEAQELIKQRSEDIRPEITETNQSERGRLFELLADLTEYL